MAMTMPNASVYPDEIYEVMKQQGHPYGGPLVAEVQGWIDQEMSGTVGPITSMNEVKDIFKRENISYKDEGLSPEFVLCHCSNRGTLGLNGYTAHKNLAFIMSVGVNKAELDNSAHSIEINPNPKVREFQLKFNEQLIIRAKGLFAPVNGKERRLSLGAGHAAAAWRASMHGCPTPEKSLQDKNGCMNRSMLAKKDKHYETCCNGWDHYVLPYTVEIAWPKLPALFQRGCNSAQNVAERQTELECAKTISSYAEMGEGDDDEDVVWARATEAAAQSKPPCTAYIGVVGRWARYFGGGAGAPTITWLDNHAKRFAADVQVGEKFLTALTDVKIHSIKHYVRVRSGFYAGQLLAKKVVNGVAECFKKSDIMRLANPSMAKSIEQAETALATAETFIESFAELEANQKVDLYGRTLLRITYFLGQNGKEGFEAKEYDDIDEICGVLLKEIKDDLKANGYTDKEIGSPWGSVEAPKADDSTPDKSGKQITALSAESLDDPSRIALKHHFGVGKLVFEKAIGRQTLFTINEIGENVKITQHTLGRCPELSVRVPIETFLKQWVLFKAEPPALVPTEWHESNSKYADGVDERRAKLFLAMRDHVGQHGGAIHELLSFSVRPSMVCAAVPVKKGQVCLTPAVALSNITGTKETTHIEAWVGTTPVYIKRQPQPSTEDASKWKTPLIPYFWVDTVDDVRLANMELKYVTVDYVKFPVLYNTKAMKAHDRLVIFKAKVKAQPLKNAVHVPKDAEDDGDNDTQKRKADDNAGGASKRRVSAKRG